MPSNEKYLSEIKNNLGYHAAWLPNVNFKLGDVGTLRGNWFQYVTDLNNLGVDFGVRSARTSSTFSHHTPSAVSLMVKVAGSTPSEDIPLSKADAGVVVKFDQESAVVFDATGCTSTRIADLQLLEDNVHRLYRTRQWLPEYFVIIELVKAENTTILISSGRDSRVVLHASNALRTQGINLANAGANFSARQSQHVSTEMISERGLTPLFRLARLKRSLFSTKFGADEESHDDDEQWELEVLSYDIGIT